MAPAARPIEERFWEKVSFGHGPGACWMWVGGIQSDGYGTFFVRLEERRRVQARAHRFSYELNVGPIPKGLGLDHLCRNRECVNPAHLEPVTQRENVLRGEGTPAKNAKKTHCIRGHPLSGDNVYNHPDGSRRCRECIIKRGRENYKRKKARQL